MTIRAVFDRVQQVAKADAGQTIFEAGSHGEHMFGVISGTVDLRKDDLVVAVLGPGDTFGEMALIDDSPRSLTAVAIEPATLAVIDRALFLTLISERPSFAIDVMTSLARWIRDADAGLR